jgi:MoaA/NifB/PqqE/SkfB family radical SAM enzyme
MTQKPKKLFRLTLDTNPEDCNLNCIMCEEHSPYSNFKEQLFAKTGVKYRRMPKEWIEHIFEEAKELGVKEIIPSTMGEPLLYKDIDMFFILAKKHNIKINLTTNGTFPSKSVKEWGDLIIPVTSDTKISLNGATKETAEKIMTGLDFEKQILNIREFVAIRNKYFSKTGFYSRITLQLTFMQNNMYELSDIVKLATELDIDRIKGHHLWTHFDKIKDLSFKNSEKSMQKWNKIVKRSFEAVEKYRKPNGNKITLNQVDFLKPSKSKEVPYEYNCPFLEKELWISATGKISPCCAPDEQRNSLGDFGQYPETSLSDVLDSRIYKNLVENYKSNELCKTCIMRKPV